MSSIGPQLPPQFNKRKRSADDDALKAPPSKATRSTNGAEPASDSDSEAEYGPSAVSTRPLTSSSAAKQSIGPTLPSQPPNNHEIPLADADDSDGPQPLPRPSTSSIGPTLPPPPPNRDEIPIDSSDDDTAGPAPPKRRAGPTPPAPAPKRVHGPSPPPAPLAEQPPTGPDPDSDSDSDYGPAMPSAGAGHSTASGPSRPAPSRPSPPPVARRDDWMVAPPPPSTSHADPTRIKARGFSSNPRGGGGGATGGGGVPGEISALWTETAAEKRQRLADQVLGRAPAAGAAGAGGAAVAPGELQRRRAAEERDARIRANTEASRGVSMYAAHQSVRREERAEKGGAEGAGAKGSALEDEDDPSKRAFDWEKDMRSGSGVSHSQRRDMVNRAADFGGRFQKGSYL